MICSGGLMKRFIEGADRGSGLYCRKASTIGSPRIILSGPSMLLSMRSTLQSLASRCSRQRQAGLPFILLFT